MERQKLIKKPVGIIVDDDPTVLENVVDMLKQNNYHNVFSLESCESGEEALELAEHLNQRNSRVAFLLTDIRMPEMDGFELVERFKDISPNTRQFVLTGYSEESRAIEAFNSHLIDYYFRKPIDRAKEENILSKINTSLRRYFISNGDDVFIKFDHIRDEEFLRKYFEGRYHIWLHEGWVTRNKRQIDIDYYDFFSEFIGCYLMGLQLRDFIGGIRIIQTDQQSSCAPLIEKIINYKPMKIHRSKKIRVRQRIGEIASYSLDELITNSFVQLLKFEEGERLKEEVEGIPVSLIVERLKNVFPPPLYEVTPKGVKLYSVEEKEIECILPAWRVHNSNGELDRFYESLKRSRENLKLVEISRLYLDNRFRGKYLGLRIADVFNLMTMAYCLANKVTDAIVCSNPVDKRALYSPLGARDIEGTKVEQYYDNAPSVMSYFTAEILLDNDSAALKEALLPAFRVFLEKWKNIVEENEKHVACACPNLEHCVKFDYSLPLTTPVKDYHCPMRLNYFFKSFE